MTNSNILIKHKNVKLIYKTVKQFWGISFNGIKRRLSKSDFSLLLCYKKLISYKESTLKQKQKVYNSSLIKKLKICESLKNNKSY